MCPLAFAKILVSHQKGHQNENLYILHQCFSVCFSHSKCTKYYKYSGGGGNKETLDSAANDKSTKNAESSTNLAYPAYSTQHIPQTIDDLQPNPSTTIKSTKKGCAGKETFTGCFVGFEVGINSFAFLGNDRYSFRTFPANIIFGYQHFFTHRSGLEIRANLGYSYDYILQLYDSYFSSVNMHAVQYGLEVAYLINFGRPRENFAWGMDFGLGVGAISFLGELNGGTPQYGDNTALIEHNTKAYLTMLRVGFHWYYTNHLFWLNFKGNGGRDKVGQTSQTIINSNPSFLGLTFSYAYRF